MRPGAVQATPVWDDREAPTHAPLRRDATADACVIGLGGSGLAAIAQLLSHGLTVVGLDAGAIGMAAAGRNAGFLLAGGAPFHHDAVAEWGADAALAVDRGSREELDQMIALAPGLVRQTGSIRLAHDQAELADCEAQFERMRSDGLPVERYRGGEGAGLLFPGDAVFQPLEWCRKVSERLADSERVTLHERSPAVSIESGAVVGAVATVRAPLVVIAVDGNLHRVVPSFVGRVRPVRLQMLATEPTAEVRLPRPVYHNYGYNFWRQLKDGSIVLGGCRDRHLDESETDDEATTEAVQHDLERLLHQVVGVRAATITHRWAGVVGYTADERPLIEEVAPGVWAVGGYSGTGNLIGRRAARGVVELALTGCDSLLEGLLR